MLFATAYHTPAIGTQQRRWRPRGRGDFYDDVIGERSTSLYLQDGRHNRQLPLFCVDGVSPSLGPSLPPRCVEFGSGLAVQRPS